MEENNHPRSSGKHSCGSLGERVQNCTRKEVYRMAPKRPLALHELRYLWHRHDEERSHPSMGPTTLRVLSTTSLRQSET